MLYTIVLSACREPKRLQLAIAALAAQDGLSDRFEVIVADAGGDDATRALLLDLAAPFPLQHLTARKRSPRNRAIRHARGRYVAFCTAAFFAQPHFLQTLDEVHQRSPEAVLSIDSGDGMSLAPWLVCSDACLVVPRSALLHAGGFQEALLGCRLSAWELGYRLHQAGCTLLPIGQEVGQVQAVEPEPDEKQLRAFYEAHGFEEFALTLMTVVPPWRDRQAYAETLQAHHDFQNGTPEQQAVARALRRGCKRAAKTHDR